MTTQISRSNRRAFLVQVGQGMLAAELGLAAAVDLGLTPAHAAERGSDAERLTFGDRERLVAQIQEASGDKVLPLAIAELRRGTSLNDLVAAAALANARAFGGEDYIGFHTFMAFSPALYMAEQMPTAERALPVLKVMHRNARRLAESGGSNRDTLKPIIPPATTPTSATTSAAGGDRLRDAVHRRDANAAEQIFAATRQPNDLLEELLPIVEENADVHRVVLAHRSWDMLQVAGKEHAHSMLRQSLRYCVRNEEHAVKYGTLRTLLPKLIDQYKLVGRTAGTRQADDAWIDKTSQALFAATAEQGAEIVAGALAEGFTLEAIGEAISLTANQLVLRDEGRIAGQTQPGKPLGSVHGDSIGVHASDSAHAWRGIAKAASARQAIACLIVAGYHVSQDRTQRGGNFLAWKPRPYAEDLEKLKSKDEAALLRELEGAIRGNNQALACAAAHRCLDVGNAKSVFNILRQYAISEDGALHAEKYYRTVSDEYGTMRPAFRNRQVVALARVTASEFGNAAPGVDEAKRLLKG